LGNTPYTFDVAKIGWNWREPWRTKPQMYRRGPTDCLGQGCVRFKKLEDLALDVVGRTVARVPAEEYRDNYQAARALMGKGRNAGEGAAGLSKSSAKKGARKPAVKKAKSKK